MAPTLQSLYHVGIVVDDFDRAVADYERRWGVAVESVVDLSFPGARPRGEEVDVTAQYGSSN